MDKYIEGIAEKGIQPERLRELWWQAGTDPDLTARQIDKLRFLVIARYNQIK